MADCALTDESLQGDPRRQVEEIRQQMSWLAELVAVGDASPTPPSLTPVDVGEIVELSARATHHACGVHIELHRESATARVEPRQVRRAIGNVLDNATRAAGSSGQVRVSVRRREDWVSVVVDDDGPGFGSMPSRHGLGLQVAALVARHHGGIVAYGVSPLSGARVMLLLPVLGPGLPVAGRPRRTAVTPVPCG